MDIKYRIKDVATDFGVTTKEISQIMEKFFEKKVFLKMFVKVNPDWRESKKELKKFGYIY